MKIAIDPVISSRIKAAWNKLNPKALAVWLAVPLSSSPRLNFRPRCMASCSVKANGSGDTAPGVLPR